MDRSLVHLQEAEGRRPRYDRVNDVFDRLEDDPGDPTLRRRRYADPPVWGVVVPGPGTEEDWLILWDLVGDVVTVLHLGPDLR